MTTRTFSAAAMLLVTLAACHNAKAPATAPTATPAAGSAPQAAATPAKPVPSVPTPTTQPSPANPTPGVPTPGAPTPGSPIPGAPTTPGNPTTKPQPKEPLPGDSSHPPAGVPSGAAAALAAAFGGGGGGGSGEPTPRAYDKVITKEAKTRVGLFKTHRIGTRLYYEIPRQQLDKDMLLVGEIAQNSLGEGFGGEQVDNHVLRWERRDNRILLRSVYYEITADSALPVYRAVAAANYDAIIAIFNVEAYGPDSAAVIEVTRLFIQSPPEFSPTSTIRGGIDASRSFIERVAPYPDNIEVESTITITGGGNPLAILGAVASGSSASATHSIVMHWSMVKLPEHPMTPRLADPRVGFFTVSKTDFGRVEDQGTPARAFITRYRLEKKDPNAALSEPIKPIVYYVDPATPKEWVPWVKRAIEDWQPAFEQAGFKNAIIAKEAPSEDEDPDWSPEDARYSVVRWLPSTAQDAVGPHVHDPRTGEILEAHVQFYQNVQTLQRLWYFTQAAAVDPRARVWPLPDSLMGRLIEFVIAHEIGHTLGLEHNMKASSTIPTDSLRSKSYLARMGGLTPSIMDYARFNYVAQPEDNIPVDLLVPKVGLYDKWAIHWGYAPVPSATSADAEKHTLDLWAREQETKPYLRFSVSGANGADPGDNTEAVGDQDAIKATTYGLKNLKREVAMIVGTATKSGEDYSDLRDLYAAFVSQWSTELGHVLNIIGGADAVEKVGGETGVKFTPVSKARQKSAMVFLEANAFDTPTWLIRPEILRRIEVAGEVDRIGSAQRTLLTRIVDNARLSRMIEFKATDSAHAYGIDEMLEDLRAGVWSELASPQVAIETYRRNLQRTYVDVLGAKLTTAATPALPLGLPPELLAALGARSTPPDAQAVIRGELTTLDADITAAIPKCADNMTRYHLQDMQHRLKDILDPNRR